MRIRYNLIFIPLLIIAAIAVYFIGFREKKTEAAKRIADRALVNEEQIDVIELIGKDQTIRIEKTAPDQWKMMKPIEVACNPETMKKFMDGLMKMESQRDLTGVTSDQLKEYGLDVPELEIKLASNPESQIMDFKLGKTNPQGTDYYAQLSINKSTCFLIPIYYVKDLTFTVDQFRDLRAVAFDQASLVSLQVSSAVADLQFTDKEGAWYLTSPKVFPASPARLDQLFHDISDLQAKEFVPLSTVAPELSTTLADVRWKKSDGSEGWFILHGEDVKKGYYATSFSQPTPVLVDAFIYDRLALSPDLFFHVLLIDLPVDQIKKVIVRQPSSERLEIERGEKNAWTITRPENLTVSNPGDFDRFINALLAIQPKKSIDPPRRTEDYGFEPAYFMKMEVYGDAKDPIAVIYLGSKNEAGDYYATQKGDAYFTIDQSMVKSLIATMDVLRKPAPVSK